MKYKKLIRDNIPEIIKQKGETPIIHTADSEEYLGKLKEKLVEEVNEFLESEKEEELADILEVAFALGEFKGISVGGLEDLRKKKAIERGAFKKKIILDEIK
jgi:predicted house-cleaning noncanonical NTP pyrophosphatase (MazG superfamily)